MCPVRKTVRASIIVKSDEILRIQMNIYKYKSTRGAVIGEG